MKLEVQSKYQEGQLLLIDKPYQWTSFDVVKKLRNNLGVKKIGHAGTLDPLATGLLLIGTGRFTKQLQFLQSENKEYTGVISLGKTTPSYDLETGFDSENDISQVSKEGIDKAVNQLTGEIEQFPPSYSAVKIDGERAYKKARRKEDVKMKPRYVNIFDFELVDYSLPELSFRIRCSKGTYIRSIAHDLGQILGVGAHLQSLRRVSIGEYRIEDAQSIEEFITGLNSPDESN